MANLESQEQLGDTNKMWRSLLKIGVAALLLLIILFLGVTLLLPKSTANIDAVETANKLYAAGNYEKSIEIFEQLVNQGVNDSVIFYNLGNAYYAYGDIGRAVANYNRAAQLDPRDTDIRANLELARSQIAEPFVEDDSGFLGVLSGITSGWLNLNETAIIALALWFLAGLLLIGLRSVGDQEHKAGLRYAIYVVIVVLFVTGLSLVSRLYDEQSSPEGVVIVPTIAVSSEPGNEYVTQYHLSSGAEVRISETNGEWARLSTPGDAIQSWIPLETVELVTTISPGISFFQ